MAAQGIGVQVGHPDACCSSSSCSAGERVPPPTSLKTKPIIETVDVDLDISHNDIEIYDDDDALEITSMGDVISAIPVPLHEIDLGAPSSSRIGSSSRMGSSSSSRNGTNITDGDITTNGGVGRICQVCCDTVPAAMMSGCSGCVHKYCVGCIGRYWETQIFSGHHARLTCLHGGCGTAATDGDVLRVVSFRVFRRMIYFRARDRYPAANFCPFDSCWERLTSTDVANGRCGRCNGKICMKCFEPAGTTHGEEHHCTNTNGNGNSKCGIRSRTNAKKQRTHELSFKLWAMTHTKACPTCNSRIQRAKGCSHMTCIKCSAYFCWRCKGYLNADCIIRGSSNIGTGTESDASSSASSSSLSPNTGNGNNGNRIFFFRERGRRSCICDKVLTSIAYGGLISIAILGSPLFLSAAVVGGPPWLIYRVVKRSGRDNNTNNGNDDGRTLFVDPSDERRRRLQAHAHEHHRTQHREQHLRRGELSMRTEGHNHHNNHAAHMRRRQQLRRRNSE